MPMNRPSEIAADSGNTSQTEVLNFLDRSSFGGAGGGKRIDTHASIVFLGNDRALKIKRAVRLPFLDYSTLQKRKLACEAELKVNAVNAPELYRQVVAITRSDGGVLEIGGTGTPVEWAVEMARFDEQQTLDHLAVEKIDPSLAISVADSILRSHERATPTDGQTWLASISGIIDRNTEKFHAVPGLDAVAIDHLHALSRDYVATLRPVLERRAGQGCVRRCHGDLHLANIALVNAKPLLFDAIEFDPVIATTDTLYDLAFTLMDLIHFDNDAAANAIFNRYIAGTSAGTLDGLAILPLFLSMRAAIRAHVLFTKSEQMADGQVVWREAKRYFDLAGRLIAPKPPLLVAIGGFSGTGKSVLARALAGIIGPPPGAVIVRSDVVRKHLFGVSETTSLSDEAYRAETTQRVYETLSRIAGQVLAQGVSVVLDATFLREAQRTALTELASRHQGRFVGLFLTADLAVRVSRVERRTQDASDATPETVLQQDEAALGTMDWQQIDASGTPEDTLRQGRAALDAAGYRL